MRFSQEFIDQQYTNKLSDDEFKQLVKMTDDCVDIMKIYQFLDSRVKDPRTKWKYLTKALLT